MAVQDKDKLVSLEDLKTAYDGLDGDIIELMNTLNHKADLIYDTASGDIASFPDGADGLPVKALTVSIEPVQSGTGDPSPTNVRPISGWTGCNISHSGADTSDPTVIPISWQSEAGTVYGGTLDLTSGVLTVDRAKCVMGGGNLTRISNWFSADVNNQSWGAYLNEGQDIKQIINDDIVGVNFISDQIKDIGASYGNRVAWTGGITKTSNGVLQYFGFRIAKDVLPSVSSSNELATAELAYLNANPIELVFQIAPKTYQLTPEEVTTLLGQNNIWADCGPSTVEYGADTKLYIDKKLAALVAALS